MSEMSEKLYFTDLTVFFFKQPKWFLRSGELESTSVKGHSCGHFCFYGFHFEFFSFTLMDVSTLKIY